MTDTVSSPAGAANPAHEPPPSLLTHIALPVRSLDDTLAFYEKFTTLVKISERHDP
ncbi:MAG: VOC family protein, partial [Gemmatimonadetes bacterium]|nr:VOC family protein [Gemmatimonadota bacterium]